LLTADAKWWKLLHRHQPVSRDTGIHCLGVVALDQFHAQRTTLRIPTMQNGTHARCSSKTLQLHTGETRRQSATPHFC
jgi:hypothetical protein